MGVEPGVSGDDMIRVRRVSLIFGAIGITGSVFLIVWSYCFGGWRHDVLLNSGFMILGALFTALIVDRLVQFHEASRWDDARKASWERVRTVTTGLVQGVAIYYPNPKMTLNSPSNITGSQAKIDAGFPGRSLYTNPSWVIHIRSEVVPSYRNGLPELEEYQFQALVGLLDRSEKQLTECLSLFSQLLNPVLIDKMIGLLDAIRTERPLVQIVHNETKSGGAVTSNPRPMLAPLLSHGIDIIEEINKRFEATPSD